MDESAMSSAQDRAAIPSWPNWLGIVVDDLEAQRRFYSEMLELEEVDAGEDWVQFDMGEGNLFEILRRNDQPQYDRRRFQPGFAVQDVQAARARLLERGGGDRPGGERPLFRRRLVLLPGSRGNVFEVSQRLAPPEPTGGDG
jgi:catechol 2,3-dioxygenase-like lactoylglutathione lyase family enzyme